MADSAPRVGPVESAAVSRATGNVTFNMLAMVAFPRGSRMTPNQKGRGSRRSRGGERNDLLSRQKCRRRAICIDRLLELPVITPKVAFCLEVSGFPSWVLLGMLKASARNSRSLCSAKRKILNNEKSSVLVPGPRMLNAPMLPPVKGAGLVTALVLNQRLGPRPPEGAELGSWPGTTSTRQEFHTP